MKILPNVIKTASPQEEDKNVSGSPEDDDSSNSASIAELKTPENTYVTPTGAVQSGNNAQSKRTSHMQKETGHFP